MFVSLRSRLLFSYAFIITLTLCIIGAALLFILLSSPLPARQTYQRLTDIAHTAFPTLRTAPEKIDDALTEIAIANNIRILRVDSDQVVLFSSHEEFQTGQSLASAQIVHTEDDNQQGTYRDEGDQVWLFVAFDAPEQNRNLGTFVFAAHRPRAPIFNFFGESLLRPLLQAGAIGMCLSSFLAILISNSVARPLRRTAAAAHAIAGGDYDHRAPESGPAEVRELAHAFNEMAGQVQRTQQMQRDFLANVSHELKTPLTSIQGYAQAILDGAVAQPGYAAKVIYDESARMHRLVEDLLDLARLESGQSVLRREHTALSELLLSVIEHLSLRADEQGVSLLQELYPLPGVTGDSDRLAQVFTNLIDNAITHTPQGGQVVVRAYPLDGGVGVAVSDSGKGIPPDELPRIFERFYQVDKSRARSARKGTGLGLTITKELIEAHGGRLRAENNPSGGATFTIWLPLPRSIDETVTRLR